MCVAQRVQHIVGDDTLGVLSSKCHADTGESMQPCVATAQHTANVYSHMLAIAAACQAAHLGNICVK